MPAKDIDWHDHPPPSQPLQTGYRPATEQAALEALVPALDSRIGNPKTALQAKTVTQAAAESPESDL